MKKFLVLYSSSVPASEQMKNTTPEQAKAGMELWMAWSKKAGPNIVDLGAPLGNAARVRGGSSDSKVSGFSILQAESKEAVTKLLAEHPHFHAPGASIDVFEFLPIPGM